MAIKLLENAGIENTGIGASALNNLITGNKSGIVGKYLNECAFMTTGNTIIIDTGLLIICGRQVEIDAIESITLSSSPSEDVRYQIVIELTREESGEVTASIFVRQPSTLIQENLLKDGFVYQFELGRVTHKTTGQVTEALRTADILTAGGGGGADFEIGDVTTEMLAEGIPAEVDIEKRTEDDKTFLDFTFAIPKGDRLVGEDIKDTVTTFVEASTRANIATGEKTSTIFGKIKKWFTDLKPHAFNDLDSVPTKNSTNLVTSGGVYNSTYGKVYRSIFDLFHQGAVPTNTEVGDIVTAMGASTILISKEPMSILPNLQTGLKDSSSGTLQIIVDGNRNAVLTFSTKPTNSTEAVYYTSRYQKTDTSNKWSGWKRMVDDTGISNPNLLINSNLAINQRGKNNYNTIGQYTADRWRLVSGTVTVTDDEVVLRGTIEQTLEQPVTGNVVASISAVGGEITYHNGVVTVTADGVFNWAKLEVGNVATAYSPPMIAEELPKCQRYFQTLAGNSVRYRAGQVTASIIDFTIPLAQTLRIRPTITGPFDVISSGTQTGFTFSSPDVASNAVCIRATKTSHGLTDGLLSLSGTVELDAEIY